MPLLKPIQLTAEQETELINIRDHHEKPYVRERSSAILKLAQGHSARQIALMGLLKPRDPDTVSAWRMRYLETGLDGLLVLPGRGRKPAFSPSMR
jgi:transposase